MRGDDHIEPFPAGFNMIAGDAFRRNSSIPFDDPWDTSRWTAADMTEHVARERAVGFLCLGNPQQEDALERHGMPSKEFIDATCHEGLRAEVAFPSCWNGKDLTSPNFKDHVAYDRHVYKGEPCPTTHPVRLPMLLYEVVYHTQNFKGVPGHYIWANGDTTGFGYHADFMSGWDPAFLKRAMDECKQDVGDIERLPCNLFTKQDPGTCKAEKYKPLAAMAEETCSGTINKLCGSETWIDGNSRPPMNMGAPPAPVLPQNPISSAAPVIDWHPPMAASPAPSVTAAPPPGRVVVASTLMTITTEVLNTIIIR